MRTRSQHAGWILVATLAACASATAGAKGVGQRNLLKSEEITKSGFIDAYSTVQSLRPQWLVMRGATSFNHPETIKVYLDGSLMGSVENLRQITTNSIESMQYMDGMEASNRYGLDHGMGAILLFSRK